MHDDLAKARSSVNTNNKKITPAKPVNQTKAFPIPPNRNNGSLTLPVKSKPASRTSGPAPLKSIHWFIIGATVLIVLNIIIWGIALTG